MSPTESFKKLGYACIENVLTDKQCTEFAAEVLYWKDENRLLDEREDYFYENSWGKSNMPGTYDVLLDVQPRIEDILQVRMKPANTYARVYYKGGLLRKHIDRNGLDYTMSITLFSNVGRDWPLWCKDLNGDEVPLTIPRGAGGIMYGTKMLHWRNLLECEEDQFVVQMFFHWSFV